MRHFIKLFLLTVMIGGLLPTTQVQACNYSALIRSLTRAVAKWEADPTQARADRICRILKRIDDKFTNTPPTLTPVPPDGVACPVGPPVGNGRGGGPGGLIIGTGQGGTAHGWVRNLNSEPCEYEWEVIPDPLNPPGFTVLPTSGTVLVPPFSSLPAPFDIALDPSVNPTDVAFFDIFWTDTCLGLPLPDDSSRFQVFADPEISLFPADPFLLAEPGLPLPVMFEITNHTASPVSRTFDFLHIGDPASVMELNDGMPFDAINLFPDDKSVSSVDVVVDPFATELILKETLLAGEICDPAMINCCGLRFGDSFCCANIFNDDLGPRAIAPLFHELVGQPTGVGNFGYQIGPFMIQLPTDLAPSVAELLDLLTLQTLNQSLFLDDFNFIPLVDDNGFLLLAPPPLLIQPFSNDPGLFWQPVAPPIFPLLPLWPEPGLELMTQALVPQVNGWLPPPGLEPPLPPE